MTTSKQDNSPSLLLPNTTIEGPCDDLALRALCLCDGYGGFELGLRSVGVPVRTVARVERDSYAAAVLVARMEEAHLDRAPVWDDLTTFDGAAWRGRVDLVTAGFPCQPWSSAGKQAGVDDDRWLWPSIASVVRDVGPSVVFLENVPGLNRRQDGGGLAHVLSDLADLGFDAEWGLLSAAAVGAPHERQRIWILAHAVDARQQGHLRRPERSRSQLAVAARHCSPIGLADSERRRRVTPVGNDDARQSNIARSFPPALGDFNPDRWVAEGGPEPSVRRSTDGRPLGLADALHLGGNGLVPLAAGSAFLALAERFAMSETAPSEQMSFEIEGAA